MWRVCSRVCLSRELAGTATRWYWPSLFPRSSTTACRSSGFGRARRTSSNHVSSISALSIRRVPDVAFWARPATRPTLCWCSTFRRSTRSGTGSTAESRHSVSSTTNLSLPWVASVPPTKSVWNQPPPPLSGFALSARRLISRSHGRLLSHSPKKFGITPCGVLLLCKFYD